MKKYLILLLFLVSCTSSGKLVNQESYSEVNIGASEKELKQTLGKPDTIKDLGPGEKQYKYIERVIVDDRNMETRYYLFIIKDGIVTSKKMTYDTYEPLLERNAYDMQTSSLK